MHIFVSTLLYLAVKGKSHSNYSLLKMYLVQKGVVSDLNI